MELILFYHRTTFLLLLLLRGLKKHILDCGQKPRGKKAGSKFTPGQQQHVRAHSCPKTSLLGNLQIKTMSIIVIIIIVNVIMRFKVDALPVTEFS